eukprot:scaffold2210_cov316-Pinguiococcus_pyrenoidosus.AAC.3
MPHNRRSYPPCRSDYQGSSSFSYEVVGTIEDGRHVSFSDVSAVPLSKRPNYSTMDTGAPPPAPFGTTSREDSEGNAGRGPLQSLDGGAGSGLTESQDSGKEESVSCRTQRSDGRPGVSTKMLLSTPGQMKPPSVQKERSFEESAVLRRRPSAEETLSF